MQKTIEGMVRECTDGFLQQSQRSFLSSPSTPWPSGEPRKIQPSPSWSDTASEETCIFNQVATPTSMAQPIPPRTQNLEQNFEPNPAETPPGYDDWSYVNRNSRSSSSISNPSILFGFTTGSAEPPASTQYTTAPLLDPPVHETRISSLAIMATLKCGMTYLRHCLITR
jgi:hypothetical protein